MKKVLTILAIAVLGFTVSCSKSSPEAEAKAMMNDTIKLHEITAEKLEKASTAKEAADVLIAYATEMKVLAKKGEELSKKYPDMKLVANEKFDAEEKAAEKAMARFMKASMSAGIKYANSKEFQEAAVKMQEIMK